MSKSNFTPVLGTIDGTGEGVYLEVDTAHGQLMVRAGNHEGPTGENLISLGNLSGGELRFHPRASAPVAELGRVGFSDGTAGPDHWGQQGPGLYWWTGTRWNAIR